MTYPHIVFRNPLSRLLQFLDSRHEKENWRIFEFRAEGTGYDDKDVRDQVEHFPWPDHHPPPFSVLLELMNAMNNWLDGDSTAKRVVVLHCAAGKGRSGTAACSLLITRGWKADDALRRFTERRMRVGWGDGVSIKSQRRWVYYMARWATLPAPVAISSDPKTMAWYSKIKSLKVQINQVRIWGLREGVNVLVRGYFDNGKKIGVLKNWNSEDGETVPHHGVEAGVEREAVEAESESAAKHDNNNLISSIIWGNGSLFGNGSPKSSIKADSRGSSAPNSGAATPTGSTSNLQNLPAALNPAPATITTFLLAKSKTESDSVVTPTLDANICILRRNRNITSMVTSTAHSWFNPFFEGNGPELDGNPKTSGTYRVDWDSMDGLKGSSRRGVRAMERVEVDWKIVDDSKPMPVLETIAIEEEAELQSEQAGSKTEAPAEESDAEDGVKTYGVEEEPVQHA
jgi:protein-tyrosine phosphatase